MMKWLFALLLLASLAFFAYMQWGGAGAGRSLQVQSPLNADKIRLLPASAVAQAGPPPAASAVAAEPVCMEWGSFADNDLARATAALAALKLGNRLSQRQVEHVNGYWVYLPPLASNAELDKEIAGINALGVDEYFVVQDAGKWHNAVSLGVFKTEEAAHKFRDSVRAKGLKTAKAGERMSKRTSTVFVVSNPDSALTAKMVALQKNFPGSALDAATCGD